MLLYNHHHHNNNTNNDDDVDVSIIIAFVYQLNLLYPTVLSPVGPIDLWNYPLGARTMAVRQKQLYIRSHPRRKQILEDLGFRWRNGNADLGWLDVVHAAASYSQLHGRVLNVPLSFAVPAPPPNAVIDDEQQHAWPWPERLWGLKLGQRLKDVRLEGAYLKGLEAHSFARRS
jgi:hypothetical protein